MWLEVSNTAGIEHLHRNFLDSAGQFITLVGGDTETENDVIYLSTPLNL